MVRSTLPITHAMGFMYEIAIVYSSVFMRSCMDSGSILCNSPFQTERRIVFVSGNLSNATQKLINAGVRSCFRFCSLIMT